MVGKTILLVDDHETVRMGVGAALRHHWESDTESGPEIIEADSVRSALQKLGETVVDVAIIDLRLGDGSGLQIAQAVSDNRLETRCVVLTSLKSPRAQLNASKLAQWPHSLKRPMGQESHRGCRGGRKWLPMLV